MTKWQIKEKLFLISCVLINGDNWTNVCDQLNKWMKFTSTYATPSNASILRTTNQCSKQFKFLLKNYSARFGTTDLKKIYNELVEERLKELKDVVSRNQDNFLTLCKEIEQIMTMDSSNFDELTEIWQNIKSAQVETLKIRKPDTISLNVDNEAEELEILEKNLEKIYRFKKEQADKQAAIELKKQQQELLLASEANLNNAHTTLNMQTDKFNEIEQGFENLISGFKYMETKKPGSQVLDNQSTNVEMTCETAAEVIQNDTNEASISKTTETADKYSSDDDLPLKKLSKKHGDTNAEIKNESGIEWKPIVDSMNNEVGQPVENSNTEDGKANKSRPRVVDYSSQSSSISVSSENEDTAKEAKEIIVENGLVKKKEEMELIFTPLIKYDKADESKAAQIETDINILPSSLDADKELESKSRKTNDEASIEKTKVNEKEDFNEEEPIGEQTSRVGSLRSSNKPRSSISAIATQLSSKRRSMSTNKQTTNSLNKSASQTTLTDEQTALAKSNLLVSCATNESGSPKSEEKKLDTGLLSIIKSEPVQISASSTIPSSELDKQTSLTDENLVISTRSTRNQETSAPFSSSSTSSSMSNNSFSSKFEDEKAYKAWKKAIMLVLNNISCHKHATIFMQPVRDDIAPGYSNVVFRPMDLTTIKKSIENGTIKSTKMFQRDIMLMFTNAIMYNSSNHDVHKISVEMYKEVLHDVEQLLNAQEVLNDENKPIRFKDKRSSTASDRGMVGNELERNESIESEAVIGILMKPQRKSSQNLVKDDPAETASISSSTSIPLNAKNKNSSPALTVTSSATNSKKRRPSSTESAQPSKQDQQLTSQPKAKKRRRSGR